MLGQHTFATHQMLTDPELLLFPTLVTAPVLPLTQGDGVPVSQSQLRSPCLPNGCLVLMPELDTDHHCL